MKDAGTKAGQYQEGFTLVELMIAMSLSAFLMIVLVTIWAQSASMSQEMMSRVEMNREIREVARIIGEGGYWNDGAYWIKGIRFASGGAVGITDSNNWDSDANLTTPAANATDYFRFNTSGADPDYLEVYDNQVLISRSAAAPTDPTTDPLIRSRQVAVTITCTAAQLPHPDCTGSETRVVRGFVSRICPSRFDNAGTVEQRRDVGSRTMEVEIQLADPNRAYWSKPGTARDPICWGSLAANDPTVRQEGDALYQSYVHTFRTVFTFHDEDSAN